MNRSLSPTKPETVFRIAPRIAIASAVRLALSIFALGLLGTIAHAQSTAAPVQPGYVDTNSCPPGYTACWHPYTTVNPLPVSPSAPSGTQDTNLKQVNGATVNVGTGAAGTGTPRVAVSSDSFPATVAATQSGTWTNTSTYQATASAAINISTATTTQIVAISGSKAIYISHINVVAGGTDNVTLEYGTGSNCGTGTTALSGAYPLLTGSGLPPGSGIAPILFVPAGNAFCILTSAAVQLSGFVSYAQF